MLGNYGIYTLMRIKRSDLSTFANQFKENGIESNWRNEKFEKF